MQEEKALYRDFCRRLLDSAEYGLAPAASEYLGDNTRWHWPHPFEATTGPLEAVERFWQPFRQAFSNLERRDDILMSGLYRGKAWVAATGHFTGVFSNDWLMIPASGKPTRIRYGEFARIENGRIEEVRTLIDLVDVCRQAGIKLLPPDRGSTDPVPEPATGDGVMLATQRQEAADDSMRLVEAMIEGLLEFDEHDLATMGMERFWTEDMRWYGPAGIGTTHGLDGFQKNHQGPFLKAFPDRTAPPQTAWLAEGDYVCVTGWPSVVGTHRGEYLGCPPTGRQVSMRVMDFWRRKAGLLAENWVLIDMPDLFMQLGVDLLGRIRRDK
jgi:predicted ester cyclase